VEIFCFFAMGDGEWGTEEKKNGSMGQAWTSGWAILCLRMGPLLCLIRPLFLSVAFRVQSMEAFFF
jgi:hypothetical protein